MLCQLENGRTIFFSKGSTTLDFFRDWVAYREGFGVPSFEGHWLGNENVYQITKQGTYSMTVFTVTGVNFRLSQYSDFRLGSESDDYPMFFDCFLNSNVSIFDVLFSDNDSTSLNGTTFSTYDHGIQSSMTNAS